MLMRALEPIRRWARAVEPDQVARIYRVMPSAALINLAAAVFLAWQFLGGPTAKPLLVWLAVFALVSIARVVSSVVFLNAPPPASELPAWTMWSGISTMAPAVLWGAVPAIVFAPGGPTSESLLHLTLAGVVMAPALQVRALHMPGFLPWLYAYVVCISGPLIARDLWIGGDYQVTLAASSLIVGVYTLSNGRNQVRATEEIQAQRRENAALIEALRQENDMVNAARRAAERANAAKSRFFAAANHDLRQPLQAMGLLAQTLHVRDRSVDVDTVSEQIGECVQSLGELVDELIEIARLDSGTLTPQPKPFTLNEVVHDVVTMYAPLARAKGLALQYDEPHNLVVNSDRRLVTRALSNLVANAVSYTPAGQVRVRLNVVSGSVQLDVEDTGVGIAPEDLARVFEEFYQVGNPARDRRLGLGLGLAIVKRVSDLLDLGLSVQSTPGQGSCFSLTLPLSPVPVAELLRNAAAAPDPLVLKKVLVIEDDVDTRLALQQLLWAWGCEARSAIDTATAQSHIAQGFEPDALLVDLRLAGGSCGIETIQTLRTRGDADVPVLMMTGDVGSAKMQRAREMGVQVLTKPVKPMQLRAFLSQAFAETA